MGFDVRHELTVVPCPMPLKRLGGPFCVFDVASLTRIISFLRANDLHIIK